jgi:3-hydroxyacyl-[acyl-carrier-protein] dehydratase
VLILEAMAQAAALLSLQSAGVEIDEKTLVYFAAIDNARFKRPVEPGDQLLMEITLLRLRQGVQRFHGVARVGEELAAEAEMMCAIRRAP